MKAYGEFDSAARTDEQTDRALFFSDAGIGPMQEGLRKLATDRRLDISDSARLFAALDTTIADSAGTIWNAKLQYMWWRPVTAIQMGEFDGNDLTEGRCDLGAAASRPRRIPTGRAVCAAWWAR